MELLNWLKYYKPGLLIVGEKNNLLNVVISNGMDITLFEADSKSLYNFS